MANKELVGQAYLNLLGRQATPEELNHFAAFMDEGHLNANEIGQVLQSLPEYQSKLLESNTNAYGAKLGANDNAILDQAAAKINSNFAGLGRPVSSGMTGAFSQAAQNLAMSRQSALADFYGRGLNNNAAMTASQGQNALDRGYGLRDEHRKRGYEIEDYYRQKNDYADAMNSGGLGKMNFGDFAAAGLQGAAKLGANYLGAYAGAKGLKAGGLF